MMSETCENCIYWAENKQCRRRSPSLIFNPDGQSGTDWPQTEDTDWCGEWKTAQ